MPHGSEGYTQSLERKAVASACLEAGFRRAHQSSQDVLSDALGHYLTRLCDATRRATEHAQREQTNVHDVIFALNQITHENVACGGASASSSVGQPSIIFKLTDFVHSEVAGQDMQFQRVRGRRGGEGQGGEPAGEDVQASQSSNPNTLSAIYSSLCAIPPRVQPAPASMDGEMLDAWELEHREAYQRYAHTRTRGQEDAEAKAKQANDTTQHTSKHPYPPFSVTRSSAAVTAMRHQAEAWPTFVPPFPPAHTYSRSPVVWRSALLHRHIDLSKHNTELALACGCLALLNERREAHKSDQNTPTEQTEKESGRKESRGQKRKRQQMEIVAEQGNGWDPRVPDAIAAQCYSSAPLPMPIHDVRAERQDAVSRRGLVSKVPPVEVPIGKDYNARRTVVKLMGQHLPIEMLKTQEVLKRSRL